MRKFESNVYLIFLFVSNFWLFSGLFFLDNLAPLSPSKCPDFRQVLSVSIIVLKQYINLNDFYMPLQRQKCLKMLIFTISQYSTSV